jgi:hypothetical protein
VTQRIPRVQLNPDNFLYACHSEDVARSKKNGTFHSHLRFEPFLVNDFHRPAAPTVAGLKKEIKSIAQHHFQVSPQFRRNEDIDLDTISYFTLGIATLFADLNRVFFEYMGLNLPKIPSHDTEYSDSFPLLKKVSALFTSYLADTNSEKEPFEPFVTSAQKTKEEAFQEQGEFSAEIWDIVSEIIFETFPDHAPAIMSYASWKFKMDEKPDPIDWRIRPPVGELFAKAFRSLRNASGGGYGGGSRAGASAGKGGSKGGDRPKRGKDFDGEKPHKGPKHLASEGPADVENEAEMQKDRPASKPRDLSHEGKNSPRPERAAGDVTSGEGFPQKGNRPERGAGKFRQEGGGRPPLAQQIQSDSDLAPYMAEAEAAVAKLASNPSLEEVKLRASNSFIRRHQHSFLVESGFETESRGEGRDRCIYVKQKS